MTTLECQIENGVAAITLRRGKVNALDERTVEEWSSLLQQLESDPNVRSVLLTGQGKFFSFGFDIPEFISYTKDEFRRYLISFSDLYTQLYVFPKPVVAALNGHTIAGGCMLALACDHRLMASDIGKISLNEITFGSSVFAGSTEMLRECVGTRNAERILCSGAMYDAGEAKSLDLVDRAIPSEELMGEAKRLAAQLAGVDGRAFASIKRLIREPVAARMRASERESIDEFVDIWYSEATWARLQQIEIRS